MLEDFAMYKYLTLFALMAVSITLSACNLPGGCPMSDNPVAEQAAANSAMAGAPTPDNSHLCY